MISIAMSEEISLRPLHCLHNCSSEALFSAFISSQHNNFNVIYPRKVVLLINVMMAMSLLLPRSVYHECFNLLQMSLSSHVMLIWINETVWHQLM